MYGKNRVPVQSSSMGETGDNFPEALSETGVCIDFGPIGDVDMSFTKYKTKSIHLLLHMIMNVLNSHLLQVLQPI